MAQNQEQHEKSKTAADISGKKAPPQEVEKDSTSGDEEETVDEGGESENDDADDEASDDADGESDDGDEEDSDEESDDKKSDDVEDEESEDDEEDSEKPDKKDSKKSKDSDEDEEETDDEDDDEDSDSEKDKTKGKDEDGAGKKKIKLKPSEGSLLTKDQVNLIAQEAAEDGLTREQAQKRLEREESRRAQFVTENKPGGSAHQQRVKVWKAEAMKDKDIGGSKENFARNVHLANKVAKKYFDNEFRQFLDESGLGMHKSFIKGFAKLGKRFAGDKSVHGKIVKVEKARSPEDTMYSDTMDKKDRDED